MLADSGRHAYVLALNVVRVFVVMKVLVWGVGMIGYHGPCPNPFTLPRRLCHASLRARDHCLVHEIYAPPDQQWASNHEDTQRPK